MSLRVLWMHYDLKNLQNLMTQCAAHPTFAQRIEIERKWVSIQREVRDALKELDEDCKAHVDAVQYKEGSGSEQVFCSERCIWETPLK